MMILRTRLLLTTLILFMSTTTSAATDKPAPQQEVDWYQVDVLVISRLDKAMDSIEAWPPIAEHRIPLDAVKLYTVQQRTISKHFLPSQTDKPYQRIESATIDQATYARSAKRIPLDQTPDIRTQPFIQLPTNDQLLNSEASSIKRSRDYRLLYQASWRMPLAPESHPVHIYIEAGQKVGNDHELEGIITLSARRFIHAAPQLWLNRLNPVLPINQILLSNKLLVEPPHQASALTTTATQILSMPSTIHYTGNFLMAESRRLKTDVINYFDSPSLAVLLTIKPYETQKTKKRTTTENSQTGKSNKV